MHWEGLVIYSGWPRIGVLLFSCPRMDAGNAAKTNPSSFSCRILQACNIPISPKRRSPPTHPLPTPPTLCCYEEKTSTGTISRIYSILQRKLCDIDMSLRKWFVRTDLWAVSQTARKVVHEPNLYGCSKGMWLAWLLMSITHEQGFRKRHKLFATHSQKFSLQHTIVNRLSSQLCLPLKKKNASLLLFLHTCTGYATRRFSQ